MNKHFIGTIGLVLASVVVALGVGLSSTSLADPQEKGPPTTTKADKESGKAKAPLSESRASDVAEGMEELPSDPAFERYADLDLLARAILDLDPATLADCGFQFAEGERVLLRPHKGGLTASVILRKAVMLAAHKRDKTTLNRLTIAARKLGDKDLLTSVATLESDSRKPDLGLRLSVESLTPQTLALLKDLHNQLIQAELMGNTQQLKAIELGLSGLKGLPADHKETVTKYIAKARADFPKKQNGTDVALARIARFSRRGLFQHAGGVISSGAKHAGSVIYHGYEHAGEVLSNRPHDEGPTGSSSGGAEHPSRPLPSTVRPTFYYWIQVHYRNIPWRWYAFSTSRAAVQSKAAFLRQNLDVQGVDGPYYATMQAGGLPQLGHVTTSRSFYWIRVDYQGGQSDWHAYVDYNSAIQGRAYYLLQRDVRSVSGPVYGGSQHP